MKPVIHDLSTKGRWMNYIKFSTIFLFFPKKCIHDGLILISIFLWKFRHKNQCALHGWPIQFDIFVFSTIFTSVVCFSISGNRFFSSHIRKAKLRGWMDDIDDENDDDVVTAESSNKIAIFIYLLNANFYFVWTWTWFHNKCASSDINSTFPISTVINIYLLYINTHCICINLLFNFLKYEGNSIKMSEESIFRLH